jgi:hypothetical protein
VETLRLLAPIPSLLWQRHLFLALLVSALFALAGCGGSSSGAPTTPANPPPNNGGDGDGFSYKGANAAADEDVLRFQTNLWINIAPENRCGSCHTTQQPMFTRGDDINLAYAATIDNDLVDLANPANSRLVTRVLSGHNCWLASAEACGDIITTWIAAWADNSGTVANSVVLEPPEEKEVGSSKGFPDSPADFETTVYPLLTQYCSSCHAETAVTRQQPYFGSSNVNVAYEAAKARMRLDTPAASRFVQRLGTDFHNCWDNNCATSATAMRNAIQAFADTIDPTEVPEGLVMSKAVGLGDAFVLTSGGRVDTDLIAKYEFKTGSGTIAYDTSGIEPATNLNLVGNVGWSSAWGIRLADNGKAQASTAETRKIYNLIRGAGEYSIETWIIPDNIAQGMNDNNPARIVSLSGSADMRNFTLGQYETNYSFMNRTNQSDANGLDELATNGGVVASLQHLVATFDPINGRRIYINGELTNSEDPTVGAALADWDNSYALVVGNEVSNNRMWQGSMRFLGIHNRAMTADDIVKNFEVGVGARYLLLFGVGDLIDVPFSYIVFEVQQFDDYGYLFSQPFFTILADPETGVTAQLTSDIDFEGIRIGINGEEVLVGQAFANLSDQLSANKIIDGRQPLSSLGTVIEAKRGPDNDEFFLTFDQIGTQSSSLDRTPPVTPAIPPADIEGQPLIGLRTFEEIDATLSTLTTIPRDTEAVVGVFNNVRQQMPTVPNIDGFLAAHQMGITQLTVAYCKALVADTSRRENYFCPDEAPCFNFGTAASGLPQNNRDQVFNVLLARLIAHELEGELLAGQADPAEVRGYLNDLVSDMADRDASTSDVVMASCAATFGSAVMLLK